MVRRDHEQNDKNQRDANEMPPHRYVVQKRHQAHAERVQQAVQEQHDRVDADDGDRRAGVVEQRVEQRIREKCQAEVNAGRDSNLPEQVEPSGEPAPRRRVLAAELRGPVVQTTGGRIAGAHLGHGKTDHQDHDPDQRPADVHDDRAAGVHPVAVEGQTARQDRDDRE